MSDISDAYHSLWNQLELVRPSLGFANEKDRLFFMERDLDRKISLLQIATLIEISNNLGKLPIDRIFGDVDTRTADN